MLGSLAGATWVMVATIPVSHYGEVVAHSRLDLVTVTAPGAASSEFYDSNGQLVKKALGPSDFKPRTYTDDSYLAMTSSGEIIPAHTTTDIDSYGTSPWTPHWARVWMQLGTGNRAQSFFHNSRILLAVGRSWDHEFLYIPKSGRIEVVASSGTLIRMVFMSSTVGNLIVAAYRIWPLPGNRVLIEAGLRRSGNSDDWNPTFLGVPVLTEPKLEGDSWVTSYLAIVDMASGATQPILGLRSGFSGEVDRSRYPRRAAVFNNGRSIAVLFDGKLYILKERKHGP